MILWECTWWFDDRCVYFKGDNKEQVKQKFEKYLVEQKRLQSPYLEYAIRTVKIERSRVIL